MATPDVELQLARRLSLAVMALIAVVGIGVAGYTLFAPTTPLLDRVYMTVVTLTTVGYGEIIDTAGQPGLRIFTMILMVFGMGVLLFSVTTITAGLIEFDFAHVFRRRRMERRIAELTHHFIVCGAGDTGGHILAELRATHQPFVVIDHDAARCGQLAERDPDLLFVQADATDEDALKHAGIDRARGLCACLPNDKDNLYLTLTARGLSPRLRIVARGIGDHIAAKLQKAGADAVVSPTAIGGLRIASELIRPHTVSFLDQMLRESLETHRFGELPVGEGSPWAGCMIRDLPMRERDVLIVAVRSPDGAFHYVPGANAVVSPGSTLIVLGRTDVVSRMRAECVTT